MLELRLETMNFILDSDKGSYVNKLCLEQVGLFVEDMLAFQLCNITGKDYFGSTIPTLMNHIKEVGYDWFCIPLEVKMNSNYYEKARKCWLSDSILPVLHVNMCKSWYNQINKMRKGGNCKWQNVKQSTSLMNICTKEMIQNN